MKIKVVNSKKFLDNIALDSNEDYTNIEFDVLAIRDRYMQTIWSFHQIGKKTFLILIEISLGIKHFFWCNESSSVDVIGVQPDNWVNVKKFKYSFDIDILIYKKLRCPNWMIQEKTFFYDTIMNTDRALETFSNNKKES